MSLWDELEKLIGKKRAKEAKSDFAYERGWAGTPYNEKTNLESTPYNYLVKDPKAYTEVPLKEWHKLPYWDAGAATSILGGIQYPSYNKYGRQYGYLPGVLAHESSHYRDMFEDANPQPYSKNFLESFQRVAKKANEYGRLPGYSGQEEPDEVHANLLAIEALSPSGQRPLRDSRLQDLFKDKGMALEYLKRKLALPKNLDAMTGIPEN